MTFSQRFALALAAVIALAVAPSTARAVPAIISTTPDIFFRNTNFTLGYLIQVNSTLTVNTLGYVDTDGPGTNLGQSHLVGIWTNLGGLLASGTVRPGDPYRAGYRYTDVADLVLGPGIYVLGGNTGTDFEPVSLNIAGATTAPEVTILAASPGNGLLAFPGIAVPSFAFPVEPYGEFNWVANFEFSIPQQVPQPGSLTLLAVTLAAIGFARWPGLVEKLKGPVRRDEMHACSTSRPPRPSG